MHVQADEVVNRSKIEGKIYRLRGHNVMIDCDLAAFYGVPTKVLNRAVKRSIERFPDDFIFQLSADETAGLAEVQAWERRPAAGRRPYAFTEQGIHAMSYFLRSDRAIKISIELIKTFHTMRNIVEDYHALFTSLQEVKKRQELESKRLWEAVRSIHELQGFREEIASKVLRYSREGAADELSRERMELIRYELDRHDLKRRDLFYLILTIFGALLTALILFPR